MYDDKRLYRSANERIIAGVCGGLGDYFEIDPTLIRLGVVFAMIFGGAGLWIYIIAAIVIPMEPYAPSKTVVEVEVETAVEAEEETAAE